MIDTTLSKMFPQGCLPDWLIEDSVKECKDFKRREELGKTVSTDYYLNIGLIDIEPFNKDQVQPASYDVRLGNSFKILDKNRGMTIDPIKWADPLGRPTVVYRDIGVSESGILILHPGDLLLATTEEVISLPRNIQGSVEGKSSLARLGLSVHSTGRFIDPGFSGQITLEISTISNPIILRPGMFIAQINFLHLTAPCHRPYGDKSRDSKYQNQQGATESKYYENKSKGEEESTGDFRETIKNPREYTRKYEQRYGGRAETDGG